MANPKSVSWSIIAVTVTLISLCALCAPANAGVSPDNGRSIGDNEFAIIGERNLTFINATGDIIPDGVIQCTGQDVTAYIYFDGPFDSSNYKDELSLGNCKVIGPSGYGEIDVYFSLPKLDVTTEVYGVDFGWVTRSGEITFKGVTNLRVIKDSLPNYISFKLLDPFGVRLEDVNGVPLTDIDVSGSDTTFLTINTTGMKTGIYTLSIETDPATNNGLDEDGPEVSFEVRSKGVTIEANKDKQTVTKDIVFTVNTTPYTEFMLDVTWGMPSAVKFYGVPPPIIGWSDEDGKAVVEASFTETGSFEITATEFIVDTTDSIFVEIVQYEAEVKVEKDTPIYHIGENIKITGKSTAGGSITLAIEDDVVATGLDVDSFEYTWKTENLAPDSYKIAIWILPFSDPYTDPPDDSVTVVLIRGGLFAETSADFVALGDEFTIEGIVPGRDRVDILTIAPDGGGGRGLDPDDISDETTGKLNAPGLTYDTTGVDTDGEFETGNITVGKDVDTGTYLIPVLSYGRDGIYGTSGNDNLLEVISNDYATSLGVKTTDQILAILKDRTINAAGTDDLLGIATIKVEKGFVTLDEMEAVPLGKNIKITGTTNRQVDTSIIVTVEGLEETTPKLKPKIAKVKEDDKTFYNTFEVSFETASANIGKYEVTADDGDGHVDATTATILLAEEPSVNVSTTPAPESAEGEPGAGAEEEAEKPTATSETTEPAQETEEETEAEEQPGFEMLFTIAGLLLTVTTVLLLRKRRGGETEKRR